MVRVAGEDDFCALADACDDGFDFVWGEVLCFVDDDVLVGDGTASDVGEGFDLEESHVDEFFVAATAAAFVFFVESHEEFDVVEDGLHPWVEFVLDASGEVSDVFSEGEDGASDEEFAVGLFFGGFLEACGECDEGFSGTGLAEEGDEFDVVVEEAVEGEVLFFVTGFDAPAAGESGARGGEGDDFVGLGKEARHGGVAFFVSVDEPDVFVGVEEFL